MAGISRRDLLVGGGAGVGLVVAWAVWPRDYAPNLIANPGESVFGAWLKIGTDGHVTVAVPQLEHGQGVYTALPADRRRRAGGGLADGGGRACADQPALCQPAGTR